MDDGPENTRWETRVKSFECRNPGLTALETDPWQIRSWPEEERKTCMRPISGATFMHVLVPGEPPDAILCPKFPPYPNCESRPAWTVLAEPLSRPARTRKAAGRCPVTVGPARCRVLGCTNPTGWDAKLAGWVPKAGTPARYVPSPNSPPRVDEVSPVPSLKVVRQKLDLLRGNALLQSPVGFCRLCSEEAFR